MQFIKYLTIFLILVAVQFSFQEGSSEEISQELSETQQVLPEPSAEVVTPVNEKKTIFKRLKNAGSKVAKSFVKAGNKVNNYFQKMIKSGRSKRQSGEERKRRSILKNLAKKAKKIATKTGGKVLGKITSLF